MTSCPLFEDVLDFDNLFSDPQIKKSLGGEDCSITPMKEGRSIIKCSNSADGCYGLFTDDCGKLSYPWFIHLSSYFLEFFILLWH